MEANGIATLNNGGERWRAQVDALCADVALKTPNSRVVASAEKSGCRMAALRCTMCMREVSKPRFVGPCMHRSCEPCLEEQIETFKGEGMFHCLQCVGVCPIPKTGLDGFKIDFKLASIFERYRNAQENTAGTTCTVCNGAASHFCRECEELYLCPGCAKTHDINPDTSDHVIIGVCTVHGKPLSFYCRPCKVALCSACRIADHVFGEHHVIPHQDVVNEAIQGFSEVGRNLKRKAADMEWEDTHFDDIMQKVEKHFEENSRQVEEKAASARTKVWTRCEELSQESKAMEKEIERLQEEVKNLMSRKEMVDKDLEKWETRDTHLAERMGTLQGHLSAHREDMVARLQAKVKRRKKDNEVIESKVALCETSRVLERTSVDTLLETQDELKVLSETKAELFSFEDVVQELGQFVPSADEMDIGKITRKVTSKCRKFSRAKKVITKALPEDRLLKKNALLGHCTNGWVVMLVDNARCHLLWTVNPEGGRTFVTIVGDRHEYIPRDIIVKPNNNVLILRNTEPIIQEYLRDEDRTLRDVVHSVNDEGLKKSSPRAFAEDEDGNFITLQHLENSQCLLVAIDREGAVLHKMFADYAVGMALSPENIIWTVFDRTISRYRWDGKEFTKLSSSQHGVDGLVLSGIALNDDEEVFVAGHKTDSQEVRVYQVWMKGEAVRLRKVNYRGGKKLKYEEPGCQGVEISVLDTQLVLACGNTVQVFCME